LPDCDESVIELVADWFNNGKLVFSDGNELVKDIDDEVTLPPLMECVEICMFADAHEYSMHYQNSRVCIGFSSTLSCMKILLKSTQSGTVFSFIQETFLLKLYAVIEVDLKRMNSVPIK